MFGKIEIQIPPTRCVLHVDEDGHPATLEVAKARHVYAVLLLCDGNMTAAARILRVDRRTMYRCVHRLGYKPKFFRAGRGERSENNDEVTEKVADIEAGPDVSEGPRSGACGT